MFKKHCLQCNNEFEVQWNYLLKERKYCSHSCHLKCSKNYLGAVKALKERPKIRISKNCLACNKVYTIFPSQVNRNKFCSQVCLGKSKKGTKKSVNWVEKMTGENNSRWIKDRTKLKNIADGTSKERGSPRYRDWRKRVWLRDNFACKIANPDCKGRLEAHHILCFSDYSELRYDVNNGITLCHAHHPRKRAEEKRLSPYFMELVGSKEII